MRKCIVLLLLLVILLSGCFLSYEVSYEFMYEAEEIAGIEIVGNENYDRYVLGEGYEIFYVLDENEIPVLLASLSEVECKKILNDPGVGLGPVVIRITYKNGDIEMLGQWNTARAWADGNKREYVYQFDREEFFALIRSYIGDEVLDEIEW